MNSRNPLIPKGSNLEQQQNARSRVKLAVFFVLTVHVVGLLALLMQGCKRDEAPPVETTPAPPLEVVEPSMPSFIPPDPGVIETNLPDPYAGTPPGNVVPNEPYVVDPIETLPPVEDPPIIPVASEGQTHTVQRGESFYSIAGQYEGVSMKAIADANPNLDPTKLQVGQKINIPPAQPSSVEPSGAVLSSGMQVYTVKSGDTLTKIATKYKTTWKAIMDLNDLATTVIKVGQQLKIPSTNAVTPDTPGPAGSF